MPARPSSVRPGTVLNEGRKPLGWSLLAPGALAIGAVWLGLTVAGGDQPVSASWPLVAGLMAAAGVGLGALVLVAHRQSTVVIERTTELAEQTALTRIILDTASDAVVTIDPDGLIVEANVEAERMFGRTPAELHRPARHLHDRCGG